MAKNQTRGFNWFNDSVFGGDKITDSNIFGRLVWPKLARIAE